MGANASNWQDVCRGASGTINVPAGLQIGRLEAYYSAERLAETVCAWNVPTFLPFPDQPRCLLKIQSLPDNLSRSFAESIASGKVTLKPTFKPFATYPVVSLVLQVPTIERTFKLEAVPDLATANVRDSLDGLLKLGVGVFYLLLDDPPELLAKGSFTVSTEILRRCLDQASAHYHSIKAEELDFQAAAQLYIQTTSL